MKKILFITALSVATFGVVNAQTASTTQTSTTQRQLPQVRAKAMVSKVTNACGLQGDQVGKVNNLYIEYFTKLDGLKNDAAKIAELDKSTNASLADILSPSQLKLWKESTAK